jgi:hypothetical protein
MIGVANKSFFHEVPIMNRRIKWMIALVPFLLEAEIVQGQYVVPYNPNAPVVSMPMTARERRSLRDRAAAYIGTPAAKPFIEELGEDAVIAVARCSVLMSRQLADFHASGGFRKVKKPHELLRSIGAIDGGDPVAIFIIAHAAELAEENTCALFLRSPGDYAFELQNLETRAAQDQAWRSGANPSNAEVQVPSQTASQGQTSGASRASSYDWPSIALGGGAVGICGLVLWMRSRGQRTE